MNNQVTVNLWIFIYLGIAAVCMFFAIESAEHTVWNAKTLFFSAFAAFDVRLALSLLKYKGKKDDKKKKR